jgi:hypothetical protein
MKHTPGPWKINRHGYESLYACHEFVEGDSGIGVCGIWHPESHREQDANARLIAAAPELLEALKQVVAWMDAPGDSAFGDAQLQTARDAISKATGETKWDQ